MTLSSDFVGFSVALAMGLLIGAEREKSKSVEKATFAAGVRTFPLIALSGAVGQRLGPVALGIAGLFIAMAILASYRATRSADRGLTTEVAMFAAFLLGALAMSLPTTAAALGVVVAIVLLVKAPLHRFTREVLSEEELRDGLLLAAAAVVVLPLLPDRTIDPWGVVNPHKLWRLVVLVMAINAAGYIATRILGPRYGMAVAGFTGGFVSSTVTIGSMGSRARSSPKLMSACVTAALLSNVATVIQLAIVVGVLSMPLLGRIAWGLVAAGATAVVIALVYGWRTLRDADTREGTLQGRPFEPKHALIFAAVVGAILVLTGLVRAWLGEKGLIVAGALAGFADVHAAAGSVGEVVANGTATVEFGAYAIVAAFLTNTVSKLVAATAGGGGGYAMRLAPGLVLMAAAFATTLLLFRPASP